MLSEQQRAGILERARAAVSSAREARGHTAAVHERVHRDRARAHARQATFAQPRVRTRQGAEGS
jgi:hypothetical protein